MSVIAHNGKVVVSGGKTLNFDNLIALANATTGETDTTLTDAVQSLIDGYGGGGGETGGALTLVAKKVITFPSDYSLNAIPTDAEFVRKIFDDYMSLQTVDKIGGEYNESWNAYIYAISRTEFYKNINADCVICASEQFQITGTPTEMGVPIKYASQYHKVFQKDAASTFLPQQDEAGNTGLVAGNGSTGTSATITPSESFYISGGSGRKIMQGTYVFCIYRLKGVV